MKVLYEEASQNANIKIHIFLVPTWLICNFEVNKGITVCAQVFCKSKFLLTEDIVTFFLFQRSEV